MREDSSNQEPNLGKEEPQEPLTSISEVIGLKGPEPLDDSIPTEEQWEEQNRRYTPYDLWKMAPTKDRLYEVTKSLKPTINSVLASMGASGNPDLASKARVIAAKAVQTYDPNAGVSLATWTSQQLRQLTRDKRKSDSVLSIPEGVMLDAYALYKAETEFEDENGREPTVTELSDLAHMSPKRIETVRKKFRRVGSDTSEDPESMTGGVEGYQTDFSKDALEYVYNSGDLLDKKLLEYTTGYGGTQPLDNKQIMEKLKLTPVQLTRRKASLSLRIKDIINDLEAVQS